MKAPKENTTKTAPLQSSPIPQRAPADQQSTGFADHRPQVHQQTAIQQLADASPRGAEIAQLQIMTEDTRPNRTGLPDNLKAGIENLSGYSLDDVRVHYNSDKPATLQAHAYAQGTDIHLASGQEKHLPHEAWHVVQQKQGRVRPTMQLNGNVNINDDAGLEKEADAMGGSIAQFSVVKPRKQQKTESRIGESGTVQRMLVCRTIGDLGYDDVNDFQFQTIGLVRFQRPAIASYTKQDGNGQGSIKHYVPHQWISKQLIDNHIVWRKRHEVNTRLTAILQGLGIAVPTEDWRANVVSFDLWVEEAFDRICDWEENLFRHSDSGGDGNGTRLDIPNDQAVLDRVNAAAERLGSFGLALAPVLI